LSADIGESSGISLNSHVLLNSRGISKCGGFSHMKLAPANMGRNKIIEFGYEADFEFYCTVPVKQIHLIVEDHLCQVLVLLLLGVLCSGSPVEAHSKW
jgi:hypothetical protein